MSPDSERGSIGKIIIWCTVGWISEIFVYNHAFCEESTILTVFVNFYTSMNIRCGAICEINLERQKIEFLPFQCKFILVIKICQDISK